MIANTAQWATIRPTPHGHYDIRLCDSVGYQWTDSTVPSAQVARKRLAARYPGAQVATPEIFAKEAHTLKYQGKRYAVGCKPTTRKGALPPYDMPFLKSPR